MKPLPDRRAESPFEAGRGDRDRHAGAPGGVEEIGNRAVEIAVRRGDQEVGDDQFPDDSRFEEGRHRGEVVEVRMGDDDRVQMSDARFTQRRQDDSSSDA